MVCVYKKYEYEDVDVDFRCIQSLKLVAYGSWGVEDNDNVVNKRER